MGEDAWAEGLMFDGSSIAGWKAIDESDMVLMPDPSSAHLDPFYAQSTLAVFCDILEPGTGEGYSRDPRMIAKRTEAYLKSTGIGDTVFVGPEAEFFVFDDVKFATTPTTPASSWTRSNCRSTRTATTRPATWATGCAPRVAISR